jgi:cell division protein FtsI/penicillin-binding protein 2
MAYRFALLIAALVSAYALLAFHLYQLQVVRGEYYLAKAQTQILASRGANGARGAIYFTDKDGDVLPAALEKQFPVIYAVPKTIGDADEAANAVAPILGMPVSTLKKIFSKPNDEYELLVRKADPEVADSITAMTNDLHLKGVYADFAPSRFYPLNAIASQLLGYVGPNASNTGESGHYGIEGFYDDELTSVTSDINLTIDPNVQIEAEKILDDLVAAQNATGGSIIVEDPQTGKVLAMGSYPNFDPNNYSASPLADLINPVVQRIYEPGSVFKVLTMAAGIDAGKLTPQTTYYDNGTVTVSGKKLSNYDLVKHGPYGMATMTNVIEHSINTGAVFAESKVGNDIFTSYLKKFGLDEKTGVDLPGELAGNLKQLNPKAPQVAFATASYGQGVAVTPLELINAMAAIANGGNLMRPYLNAALEPQVIRRVLSASTAEQVTGMMISAVDKAGVANIGGYSLAGKTGTAFIPDFVHGGYTDNVIDSYVGFGPTSAPRFIALIKIDMLPSTALAAQSVVPAFRELSQYLINYYNIPPDRIGNTQ